MSALPAEPASSPGSAEMSPAGARSGLAAVPPGESDTRPSGRASAGERRQIRAAQHGAGGSRRQAGTARRRLDGPGSVVPLPPRRLGVPGSAALQLPHRLGVPAPVARQLPRQLGVSGPAVPQPPHRLGVPGSSASSFPRPSGHSDGLRLTRRGRVVLIAAATLVASLLGFGLANAAMATDHHGPVSSARRGLSRIVVQPGQTLWSIAVRTDPSADPRLIVQRILELNGLSSESIAAGQRLWIPQG